MIEIAEKKRTEPYKPIQDYQREDPDHYDLLQMLVRNTLEYNKVIRELKQEFADLKARMLE